MTNSTFTFAIVAFILWAISATLLRFLKNEPILLKILGAIPGACGAILAILGVFQALPAPTIALLPCGKRDGCAILMLDCRVSFLDLYYTLSSPSSGSEWTRYDPDAPPHLEPGQPVHTYSQFLFFQSQIVYGGTVPPDPSPSPPDFPSPSPTLTPNPTPKPTPKPPPTPEPSPEPTPVLLQKLTLSPDRTDLFPGESLALTVTGSPPGGAPASPRLAVGKSFGGPGGSKRPCHRRGPRTSCHYGLGRRPGGQHAPLGHLPQLLFER